MKRPNSLDVVERLRERLHDRQRLALVAARGQAEGARTALEARTAEAARDTRASADAGDWHLFELSREAALRAVRGAQAALALAEEAEHRARAALEAARQQLEGVRRVVETRRAEVAADEARAEVRELDEVAAMSRR